MSARYGETYEWALQNSRSKRWLTSLSVKSLEGDRANNVAYPTFNRPRRGSEPCREERRAYNASRPHSAHGLFLSSMPCKYMRKVHIFQKHNAASAKEQNIFSQRDTIPGPTHSPAFSTTNTSLRSFIDHTNAHDTRLIWF